MLIKCVKDYYYQNFYILIIRNMIRKTYDTDENSSGIWNKYQG